MNYKKYTADSEIKLKPADEKFIENHLLRDIAEIEVDLKKNGFDHVTFTNPTSGAKAKANPVLAAVTRCVLEMNANQFNSGVLNYYGFKPTNAIQKFDRARMIVRRLDSNFYYDILD